MKIFQLLKRNHLKKEEQKQLSSSDMCVIELTEEIIVNTTDRSPVDMLAFRISQQILRDNLCSVNTTDLGSPYTRYSVTVSIAVKKK